MRTFWKWKDTREKRDMAMEQIQWFPSVIVMCWVSTALSATEFPPLAGVLMCKKKCLGTKACERFAYSSLTFTCYLQGDAIPSFEIDLHKMNISKEDLIQTDASCSPGDRIIRTRQGFTRCVSAVKSNIETRMHRVKASRVLITDLSSESILQIDLQQNEPRVRPYLNNGMSFSLLYSRLTNSTYMYMLNDDTVIVSKLDSLKRDRIIQVNSRGVMALDAQRDWILIFLIYQSSSKGIFKIVGETMTRMFMTKVMYVNEMAVCSKSQVIYLLCEKNIIPFTYSGKRNDIIRSENGVALSLDPQSKYLYYNAVANNYVFRYNTETKKTDHFIQTSKITRDIVVDSDSLYTIQDTDIVIYSLSTRIETKTINVRHNEPFVLCLVF